MCNNFHLQERYVEKHVEELRRDIRQQRLAAALAKESGSVRSVGSVGSVGRHLVSRIGRGLVALGTWLEGVERSEKQVVSPATYK